MADVIEGGVEEEVILPDNALQAVIPQGHGVEALLAAEHEKAVGGVGNVVPTHGVLAGGGAADRHVHADLSAVTSATEAKKVLLNEGHAALPLAASQLDGAAEAKDALSSSSKQQQQSRSKISELLLTLTGQTSQSQQQNAAAVNSAVKDPLLPGADTMGASHLDSLTGGTDAGGKTADSAVASAQSDLFSRSDGSLHAQHQTGVFSGTFTQLFLFGMPFVFICAGVMYWRRSRGSHSHHHHYMPKV